jgi:hypothetical protein
MILGPFRKIKVSFIYKSVCGGSFCSFSKYFVKILQILSVKACSCAIYKVYNSEVSFLKYSVFILEIEHYRSSE